jgi:prenyltransferase beta subunit
MPRNTNQPQRRAFLGASTAAGLCTILPATAQSQGRSDAPWRASLVKYLESLARDDGGYGWDGQERSHLTPTFAVIGSYKLLGIEPPNKAAVAQFVRTHHPRELKKLEQEHRQFDWQQIQALAWLGEDVSSFKSLVLSWKGPIAYLKQYEQHGYPVFQQEVSAILSWKLLNLPMLDLPASYVDYLDARRRANGSFNNTPASDGTDGHVLNTWWGLRALQVVGRADEKIEQTIGWLQNCQLSSGGFTYAPKAEIGGWDDVAYTWAAVQTLAMHTAGPLQRDRCVAYLHGLWNPEGGFSDRHGWQRNPVATYYALSALSRLTSLNETIAPPAVPQPKWPEPTADLKVFTIQIEAHGQGSPADAADLADALKIDLWGAKNAKPEWIAAAREAATKRNAQVTFFAANEEYGTWMNVPGMGTYSHMSDIIAPAGADIGKSLANTGVVSWREYERQRLAPLMKATGRLIWQFGENEPLVRMLLDDSLPHYYSYSGAKEQGRVWGGFAAISTFHFGNPDFTNSDPTLMRWRGQRPFVGLQDAHGPEPWWFADMTEGFRTLFLARRPTWEGWLEALANNWIVAVRHDAVSGDKTWMHGMPEVIEVVKKQWREWQWWDNPNIQRPLVSVVAVTPNDHFELGRPERGVAIRVRCAWTNTTQGLPKTPISELVRLRVAGKEVEPEHVVRRRPNNAVEDDYYIHNWPDAPPGTYLATARVRHLVTKEESSRSTEFTVPPM